MTDKALLRHILNFLSSFDNWEETDFLFEKVNAFFVDHFSSSPLIVFSLPKGEGGGEKKIREVWNRDAFAEFDQKVILDLIEEESLSKIMQHSRVCREGEQLEHHLFHIGDDETQSYLACFRIERQKISIDVLDALVLFLRNTFGQIQRWKGLNKQSSLIHIDDVTGLYNQRKLYKDLFELIRKYERSGENFALLFIDIDHFKSVNDNYGHLIGTKLLSDLGKVLRRVLRDTDLIYRYGGDEFVAIVPDASTNDARKIGDRVLSSVRDEHFHVEGNDEIFRISISVGIASFPRDAKDGKEVLELADRMMYRAKNRGRGCVCLAGDFYKK